MPDEHIINPWLTEQIRLYKAAHADAELREALGESCDLELDEWYRMTAETHRETVLLLRTIGADKETLRKARYEQARFLRDQIPEHPEYAEEALDAAWDDQELSEYLYGTYSKENALAWELQADILFMGGRYAEALEKYSKLVRILEKSPRFDREFLAEARRSAGICLIGLDRPAEALPLLLEAFSYYEKHPDEYRERLFWMSHTISRAYDMLGDFQKRQEYMDLAGKYDDDPIE